MAHPVADTILDQLGGRRFLAMTGARNLTGSANALSMQIPGNPKRVGYVRITIDASDTYTMKFIKSRTLAVMAEVSWIYADTLRQTFE